MIERRVVTIPGNTLEQGDLKKLLRAYAGPAMLNMVVMALYNIVDRIFIGQGAGPLAICGLALTLPYVSLLTTVGTLTGVGILSRIASALGTGNRELAARILSNALELNVLLSGILIVLSFCFLDDILIAFGGSPDTIPFAKQYLYILIPGSLLTNLNFTLCNAARASGFSKKSMTIILIGVLVNILLDPILIFGFHLGIEGAAIATVVSMCVSLFLVIRHFVYRSRLSFCFSRMAFRPSFPILTSIVGIGMAAFIMNITTGMVNIIMNRYLVHNGGDYAIGAYGIISCFSILISMMMMGICQGMQPIVSYNYGTGNTVRVKNTLRFAIFIGSFIACCGFIICEIFAPQLVRMFVPDPEWFHTYATEASFIGYEQSWQRLIQLSETGLRLTFLMTPIIGFQIIATSFFQSINKAPKAIVMNISRQFIFLIPGLGLFSRLWGLNGIWLAIPFADLMSAIVTFCFLWFEKRNLKKHYRVT